eukprot:253053-Prorocentrum_lima.AAC.1
MCIFIIRIAAPPPTWLPPPLLGPLMTNNPSPPEGSKRTTRHLSCSSVILSLMLNPDTAPP